MYMVREADAWLVAGGRRFQTRRLIHALVRRDTAMIDEPIRVQSISLLVGWLAGAVATAICAVVTMVIPPDSTGDAPVVMVRDTGALYVRVDHRLHPVFNLASARLIAHTPATPVTVTAAALAAADRGPALGIPGAPTLIGATAHPATWLACDTDQTAVIADRPAQQVRDLTASAPVLATPAGESAATTYLLYDGKRAEVDLRDTAAVRALRLDGLAAKSLSRAVLDLLPESPSITAPVIAGAGRPGPAGLRIGQVLRLVRAGSTEYYVALGQGLQRIGEVAADIIRFRYGVGGGDIPTVAPEAIAAVKVVNELAVSAFPAQARTPVGGHGETGVCVQWRTDESGTTAAVLTGTSTVSGAMQLAQADGIGPHVDSVVLPGGQSSYVRAADVAGDATGGSLYLVTDSGVLHGIHDEQAAGYLGLTGPPVNAPWPLLAQLPRGPELGVQTAELQRDALPAHP
jgi:type VII secretion protein EccB